MPDKFIFTEKPPERPGSWELIQGDALANLSEIPDSSVRCIVTSPPYRSKFDYGDGLQEHGWEPTLSGFLQYEAKCAVELFRVTKPDGNLFLVIGDSRNGSGGPGGDFKGGGQYMARRGAREKGIEQTAQLLVPERLRIAYTDAGWLPVQRIIWNKEEARRETSSWIASPD